MKIVNEKNRISPISMKVDTLTRTFMWYGLSKYLDLIHIAEYPKSGGTWVSQMVSDYLDLPFPQNQRPNIEKCIMHGHYLHSKRFKNVICVLRDGRDVMVSAYYHKLFYRNEGKNWIVDKYRKKLPFDDYDNVEGNLPTFIEFMFEEDCKGIKHFTWSEFVRSWYDKDVYMIKYENLLINPFEELYEVIKDLSKAGLNENKLRRIINKYSFKNQSNRKPGEEDTSSFLRKGISGDWKNKFTTEAKRVFQHYAGDELVMLDYEESPNYKYW